MKLSKLNDEDKFHLRQFFGNFHQDFDLVYSSYESAISEILSHSNHERLATLLEALKKLHKSKYGEKKIEKMICREFACDSWPVKLRGRPWIEEILMRIEKELAKTSPPNQ